MQRRYPDAPEIQPPAHIQPVIDAITDLLRGEKQDFVTVTLDMHDVPPFQLQVYMVARSIPFGATMTYGQIATRLGDRMLARGVGEALGQNPLPIIIPCHRVLAAAGKVGGFSAAGGVTTKLRLLEIEGASIGEPLTLFDSLPLATRPRRR